MKLAMHILLLYLCLDVLKFKLINDNLLATQEFEMKEPEV